MFVRTNFEEGNITLEEMGRYTTEYEKALKDHAYVDAFYIWLDVAPGECIRRIRKRGRREEVNITESYLAKLESNRFACGCSVPNIYLDRITIDHLVKVVNEHRPLLISIGDHRHEEDLDHHGDVTDAIKNLIPTCASTLALPSLANLRETSRGRCTMKLLNDIASSFLTKIELYNSKMELADIIRNVSHDERLVVVSVINDLFANELQIFGTRVVVEVGAPKDMMLWRKTPESLTLSGSVNFRFQHPGAPVDYDDD